jgi:hypothetical protein
MLLNFLNNVKMEPGVPIPVCISIIFKLSRKSLFISGFRQWAMLQLAYKLLRVDPVRRDDYLARGWLERFHTVHQW